MHLDTKESIYEDQFLFFRENQIPYDLQLFETDPKGLFMACLKYCELYVPDQVHLYQEREESK